MFAGQLGGLRHDAGYDTPQEAVTHREAGAPEPPFENAVREVCRCLVAGGIPCVQLDPRTEILIVKECEERYPQVVAALDSGAGSRVAGVLAAADADSRLGVVGGHPVNDELGAAVRDVVERRQWRQARRREAHRHVDRSLRPALAESEQHRSGSGDDDARRTLHKTGMCLAIEGARDAQATVRLLCQRRTGRVIEGEERVLVPLLFDVRAERQKLRAGRFRRRDEGRGASDELAGLEDFEGRTDSLPGRDPGGDGGAERQAGRESQDGANHASMIAPLVDGRNAALLKCLRSLVAVSSRG